MKRPAYFDNVLLEYGQNVSELLRRMGYHPLIFNHRELIDELSMFLMGGEL